MASERAERKLAAIVAVDIVGYARLMSADEEGTHARIKELRKTLVAPKIKYHRGRIIKTSGDGTLVEFASVVDAVRCVVEVQQEMSRRNSETAIDERIEFRVGVHLGDVMVEGDDIYGDGVNIAARLEGLAQPGGILVSAAVRDQVLGYLGYVFDDLGEQSLKNISRPVRIYRVYKPSAPLERLRAGAMSLAPRLSLVVLPFSNFGGGQEAEHFVDGMTDILTTDLSRIPGAFVIARNTAFSYKGKAPDVRMVGRELGVRYVLEGSVQRWSDRVRVSTQLLDAETGAHLWAERYDRPSADIFEMQDEITTRLARALDVHLVEAEARRGLRERPNDPDAIDLTMRGWSALYKPHTQETLRRARELFERAVSLDDCNVLSLVGLAESHALEIGFLWSESPAEQLQQALIAIHKALDLDATYARAHYVHGIIFRLMRKFDLALIAVAESLKLDRNLATALVQRGIILIFIGRPEEAFAPVEEAIRLSPRDYNLSNWLYVIGIAHLLLEHYETAIEWLLNAIEANPRPTHNHFLLAAAYGLTDRRNEAEAALQEYYKLRPGIALSQLRTEYRFSQAPNMIAAYDRIESALRQLGMPE